jgi:uroporphyrinogen decarboxylase
MAGEGGGGIRMSWFAILTPDRPLHRPANWMSPRERVLLALNHQEPDRVPVALWGSWYGVTDSLYLNLLTELGWQPVPPFRPDISHSVNYYDDRLLDLLGTDIRHMDPGSTARTSRQRADGADYWGLQWSRSGLYRAASHHPLADAGLEQIYEHRLPTADEAVDAEAIRERLKVIRSMDQEYAVAARAISSFGLFEMSQALRRPDQLLMDFLLEPAIVHALIDRLTGCYASMLERVLEVAGDQLDLVELPGDDFAGNKHPIISPNQFDVFFREPYRRLVQLIRDRCPHVKIVFHSDGAITPFLDRLLDIGIDVVHPLEPLPATDFRAVKAQFGDRLAFIGGIDIRESLQSDEARVVAEVKTRIDQLGDGGGYILAPANHLQWDVPTRNVFSLFHAAREHGRYGTA